MQIPDCGLRIDSESGPDVDGVFVVSDVAQTVVETVLESLEVFIFLKNPTKVTWTKTVQVNFFMKKPKTNANLVTAGGNAPNAS